MRFPLVASTPDSSAVAYKQRETYELDRVSSSIIPVMLIPDNLDARESVIVQQGTKRRADLSFRRDRH